MIGFLRLLENDSYIFINVFYPNFHKFWDLTLKNLFYLAELEIRIIKGNEMLPQITTNLSKPLIIQNFIIINNKIYNLKYQRSASKGCKDISEYKHDEIIIVFSRNLKFYNFGFSIKMACVFMRLCVCESCNFQIISLKKLKI